MTTHRGWSQLTPVMRRAIKVTAAIEGAVKVVALVDLSRRPASQVRGSKPVWAGAIIVVNSAGIVPLVYLLRGRRRK